MVNLLYIPHPHSKPEHDDLFQSFKKICDVYWWPNWAIEDLPGKVDFIYLQSGGIKRVGLEFIKNVYPKAKVCQWTGDCRKYQIENVMWCYDLCDINYLAAWQPELYPGMRWLPHGVADWQFREINPDAEGIVFIGNAQLQFPGGMERHKLCLELEKRKDFTWYGSPKKQVPYRDTPDIYNKHKIAICASIFRDVPKYFSNRTLAAMAAGCSAWMPRFPNMYEVFKGEQNFRSYIDTKDFMEGLKLVCERGQFQQRINGQKFVKKHFHYDKLAKHILDELTQLS